MPGYLDNEKLEFYITIKMENCNIPLSFILKKGRNYFELDYVVVGNKNNVCGSYDHTAL